MIGNLMIAYFFLILALSPAVHGQTSSSTDFMKQYAAASDIVVVDEWAKLDVNQRLELLDAALLDETNGLRTKRAVLEKIVAATPSFMAGSETATLHSIYVSKLTEIVARVWKFDYVGVADKPEARLQQALNQMRSNGLTPSVVPNNSEPASIAPEPEIISLPAVPPTAAKKASEAKPSATTPNNEPTPSTPSSIIVVLIGAAIGLLCILLKKCK